MSVISMKQLLEAGVHFGHPTRAWNPKMKKYIYSSRNNNIHIINLEVTEKLVDEAYAFIRSVAGAGKSILFVGTKKQASKALEEEAIRCGMFYMNNRWLGGTLTNFKTVRQSIDRLNKLYNMEKFGEFNLLPKKEVIKLVQEREKLEKNLGGIKEMKEMPGALFVVDPKSEHIAVAEAKKLGIPVVAICDTNCDPDNIDYVIAANDDAISSVKLIVSAMADAVIEAKEGAIAAKEDAETEKPTITTVTLDDFIVKEEVAEVKTQANPVKAKAEKTSVESAEKPVKKASAKTKETKTEEAK